MQRVKMERGDAEADQGYGRRLAQKRLRYSHMLPCCSLAVHINFKPKILIIQYGAL
jgi:hypothetical protein